MRRAAVRGFWVVLLAIGMSGCLPSAGISWAPDGKRAIYTVSRPPEDMGPADAFVIDPAGKIGAELGPVCPSLAFFGFTTVAWTADSKSAYLATITDLAGEPVIARDWAAAEEAETGIQATGKDAKPVSSAVSVWDGKSVTPLAQLPGYQVIVLRLSADEKWVAVLAETKKGRLELFALAVGSKKLYRVERGAGIGICFTGSHRLAYVRSGKADTAGQTPGKLVEVDLDENAGAIRPTEIMDVFLEGFRQLCPAPAGGPDGLLFLAWPETLTGKPRPADASAFEGITLCFWNRKTDRTTALADNLLTMDPSPDGKTLLCIATSKDAIWIELLDGDGTHPRKVSPLDGTQTALLPTWHGNDRISASGGTPVDLQNPDGTRREVFDVTDFAVGSDGKTGPATDLSRTWKPQIRPWVKGDAKGG